MDRDRALLAELIRSAARPAGTLDLLVRRCWPGGGDRRDPAAVSWLRGWGPSRVLVDVPACACTRGRCAACN